MAELDFIDFIAAHKSSVQAPDLQLSIGDDCAVVKKNEQTCLLYTMDSLIAGVHFDLDFHPPYLLGRKSVAVNVSDIAGMGGVPKFALLSISLPPSFARASQQDFMEGFFSMCEECGVTLIGGDTVSGEDLSITVTLIGEAKTSDICTRAGAKVGDEIWVSGYLGESSVGLSLLQSGRDDSFPELVKRHLDPIPQVALGEVLAKTNLVTAMMDSSDGVATDLAHICRESGCGAVVHGASLPISAMMKEATAVTGQDPLHQALCGGEDYGLLFTVRAGQGHRVKRLMSEEGHVVCCIGEMDAEQGVRLSHGSTMTDISFQGYEHT